MKTLLLSALFLQSFSIVALTLNWQAVKSQTKPLTYTEINTALNTKLPNKSFKTKNRLIIFLIAQIQKRGVDKPLTPDREDLLLEAGATDELIEEIRQNSPPIPIPTLATTPISTSTPNTTQIENKPEFRNPIGIEFVLIPAGSFMMGSPASDSERNDNETQHLVTISKSFYIGKYEVTQAEWDMVMGYNPSFFQGCLRCPVETISWDEIQEFIRILNAKGEGKYRLPTEEEWEYAARAGSTTKYSYGETKDLLGDYAWFVENSENKTHEVGTKKPNDWGVYDMHGNVLEWCQDLFGDYSSSEQKDQSGATSSSIRVYRGGGSLNEAALLRSAFRFGNSSSDRSYDLGFRLVKED